jgi:hypothetical protein
VASSPQRPFVPHRTPSRPRPAIGKSAEFRLARPFVPGAEHLSGDINASGIPGGDITRDAPAPSPAAAAATRAESDSSLQPIEDYFHRPSQAQAPITPQFIPDEFDDGSELPPVEHFLDPLPRVGDFSPGAVEDIEGSAAGHEAAGGQPSESIASEWAHTDWQQYDWRSVAALAETADTAALNAWAATDWDAIGPGSDKAPQPTAAQAIATALHQIAKRIRDGELAVPMPGPGTTDPATIAATLAALLGIRQ